MFDSYQIRRISIIALLAMIMVVFAPTVSKALAADLASRNLVEVCTTDGTKWVTQSELGQVVLTSHKQGPTTLHEHSGDCPYCSLQADKVLANASLTFVTVPVESLLPALFYQAHKPLFAWTHSRSRAPPSAS
jgi:hypothetical protein